MTKPSPDPVYVLRGHKGSVITVNFVETIENVNLVSGSSHGELFLWNLKINRPEFKLSSSNGKEIIWTGCYGNTVITQERADSVKFWIKDESNWKVTRAVAAPGVGFCKCSLGNTSPLYLAYPDEDPTKVKILDVETNQEVATIQENIDENQKFGMCMCMKLLSTPLLEGKNLLLCGYESGSVTLWDWKNRKIISEMKCHSEPAICLDFDDCYRCQGISGSTDRALSLWELVQPNQLKIKQKVMVTNPGISAVAIRSDGKIVATGGWDQRLRIFSWKTMKPLAVLDYHGGSVEALQFSTSSIGRYPQLLAAGSKDGKISLWSLYNS
ncbi:guanine nucleotide-binding protein subunit beta-like protein 1 isoform X2 [Tachypleus tridentatus]